MNSAPPSDTQWLRLSGAPPSAAALLVQLADAGWRESGRAGAGKQAGAPWLLDHRDGRVAVLKVYDQPAATGLTHRGRAARETEALRRALHRCLPAVYDAGDGWVLMARLPGRPLDAWLQANGPMPPPAVAALVAAVASVLTCLASAGVLHRDLKPAHLLVDDAGVLTGVIDLGLADLETSPDITAPDALPGSPAYLAPWAMEGPRRDLFALGVSAAVAAIGENPFDRPGVDVGGLHAGLPDQLRRTLPPQVVDLVVALLAPGPLRAGDVEEHALRVVASFAPPPPPEPPAPPASPVAISGGLPVGAGEPPAATRGRLHATILALAGAVLLTFLGVAYAIVAPGASSSRPRPGAVAVLEAVPPGPTPAQAATTPAPAPPPAEAVPPAPTPTQAATTPAPAPTPAEAVPPPAPTPSRPPESARTRRIDPAAKPTPASVDERREGASRTSSPVEPEREPPPPGDPCPGVDNLAPAAAAALLAGDVEAFCRTNPNPFPDLPAGILERCAAGDLAARATVLMRCQKT